jgi:hypothetical protein
MQRRAIVGAAMLACACGHPEAGEETELPFSARVQVLTGGKPWRSGVTGTAGNCTGVMIPDSWSAPRRFNVVLIDSVTGLRISSRYDGRPGPDGKPRTFEIPGDTTGETWRDLPLDPIRKRYGGCSPSA